MIMAILSGCTHVCDCCLRDFETISCHPLLDPEKQIFCRKVSPIWAKNTICRNRILFPKLLDVQKHAWNWEIAKSYVELLKNIINIKKDTSHIIIWDAWYTGVSYHVSAQNHTQNNVLLSSILFASSLSIYDVPEQQAKLYQWHDLW